MSRFSRTDKAVGLTELHKLSGDAFSISTFGVESMSSHVCVPTFGVP
jgi:hypothetical protein